MGVYRRVRDQLVATAEKSGRKISESAAEELVSELDAAIALLESRYRARQPQAPVRPAPVSPRPAPTSFGSRAAVASPLTTSPRPEMAPKPKATVPVQPVLPPDRAAPPASKTPATPLRPATTPVARPVPAMPAERRLEALLRATLNDELVRLGAQPVPAGPAASSSALPERDAVLPLPRDAGQLRRDIGPLAIAALVLVAVLLAAAVIVAAA
ncbi:MAG: hypothetical protein H6883_03355 [Rhodobiaceae bacterium]|nr:hypothetical protein [Rhodobiaceae bacterium]MCC0055154.1 hypothetical protein [Rhodobiaceae bacterium]